MGNCFSSTQVQETKSSESSHPLLEENLANGQCKPSPEAPSENDVTCPLEIEPGNLSNTGYLLHQAIVHNDVNGCNNVLQAGFDPDRPLKYQATLPGKKASEEDRLHYEFQGTALHVACIYRRPEIVQLLLEHSADPNVTDKFGRTPIILTVTYWPRVILEHWPEEADKSSEENRYYYYLKELHIKSYNCLQSLCQFQADVTKTYQLGQTALHLAARYHLSSCVDTLLRYGACINATDHKDLVRKLGAQHIYKMESTLASESATSYKFETLQVTQPKEYVYHVELNRPKKMNAMNKEVWREIGECFKQLGDDPDCRAVVLSGSGRIFTSGIDLASMSDIIELITSSDDIARKAKAMRNFVSQYQQTFTTIEQCSKPVIAAIHSACIGAGVDMISACDIRYCTKDAWFQIKEVDIGLAADVGTLQRLPKIIGNDSLVRELAYTVRKMFAEEANQIGLVSRVFVDKDAMMAVALDTAAQIASKSPVAVQGTKIHLNYSRDHTVQEGLDAMANWNMSMLLSEDLMKAAMASMDKSGKPAQFSKL